MKKQFVALTVIAFLSCPVWAVLPYYTGARAEGMGEAYTAVSDDNSALFYNPAGLANTEKKEISVMYWQDYFGTGYSSLAFGLPEESWGGMAAGWSNTANTFEKTDAWGNALGQSNASNDIFMLGAGYRGRLPVSLGLTAKYITENIDAYSAAGWALDAGSFIAVKKFRIGLVLENAVSGGLIGNSVAGGTVNEKLPSTLRLGFSYSNGIDCDMRPAACRNIAGNDKKLNLRYTFAADLSVPMDTADSYTVSPGAELWIDNTVAVRAGFKEMRDYTVGLSLKLCSLRLDYAFIISQQLENSNLFSVSMFF
jgi:hypothetical protein